MAVSFIGGGNRNTRRKPLTCRKSLTNFITDFGKIIYTYTLCSIAKTLHTIFKLDFQSFRSVYLYHFYYSLGAAVVVIV
jgi:hypothetical protein